MKKMKWLSGLLLMMILFNGMFVFADVAYPEPTREFYVADFAGVLSQEVRNAILRANLNYEKTKERPQIVVATVPNLQDLEINQYAVGLFEKWAIGNKSYDNGVLLLLALEERRVWIEVGYGLEGAIPDGKAGEILDAAVPALSQGNYSEGLLRAFYLLSQETNKEYGYENGAILGTYPPTEINQGAAGQRIPENRGVPAIFRIMGILFILLLLWLDHRFLGGFFLGMFFRMILFGGRGGRGGGGFGGGSSGGGGRSGGGGAGRGF
ncbi:uncharacterized protein SAMN02745975_02680 [Geosporobacter subterraneus DSM 17957]|uniref:TPM domain-containing protein n=1 Tax=Geosporobacter subterraneus DSM 17957 TaxID=1121919 RepID=A0A1M6LH32_9FIRM|nr:TPM domain-containing protein [Geosporobacter subterraneus]SHJ70500.1 uncharacterized protein SAMN02745975_02680 [Geosporobacter subterraneus DSM 17957]